MKYWQELKTINDFIESCKEVVAGYREDLSKKDKERLAGTLVALTFSDHFQAWYKQYPVAECIEAYASDLEWSNSLDIDDDWEKLLAYIKQLDKEVNGT